MLKTVADIASAIERHIVPIGPWSPPYQESWDYWKNWLTSLNPEDFPTIVELAYGRLREEGVIFPQDDYTCAILGCLKSSGGLNPETYLQYAESATNDPLLRSLLILTAGNLYFDEAVAWLATLPDRFHLSDEELRWSADSLQESGIPIALPALDRVIEQIRARNLPILDMVLGWRTALAEHLQKMAATAQAG